MKNHRNWRRLLAWMLAAVMLAALPMSALAEGTAMRVNTRSRVYRSPSLSSRYAALAEGMEVNLLATRGGWAQIERNGVIGYTKASHLSAADASDEPDYGDLLANARDAVITRDTRVYQSASTSSRSLNVKKGMQVRLLAVNGSWALVERSGCYAYMNAGHVSTELEQEPDYSELLENAKTVVINRDTKVYQSASTSARTLNVRQGMQVQLLAVDGPWALVERSGNYAFMNVDHLSTLEQTVTPTPTPVPTPTPEPEQPDYSGYMKDAKPAVINQDTRVYKFNDLASSYVDISKGTQVNLLKLHEGWALIERSGSYGFTNADHVSLVVAPTPTPAPETPEDYLDSSKYSNEQKCYLFMTKEMGLNSAAACGILANIRKECNFNPAAGSSYYGLCQWGGGRLANMKAYCTSNGYAVSSLEGQLRFMAYELQKSYPTILSYLRGVENSAQGAYDAGYYFSYHYERPANKATVSVTRGNLAKDTYWKTYSA